MSARNTTKVGGTHSCAVNVVVYIAQFDSFTCHLYHPSSQGGRGGRSHGHPAAIASPAAALSAKRGGGSGGNNRTGGGGAHHHRSMTSSRSMASSLPTSTKYIIFNHVIIIQDLDARGKAMLIEASFLFMNIIQLCIQNANLYHGQMNRYDFNLMFLTIVTLARHLVIRCLGDTATLRR